VSLLTASQSCVISCSRRPNMNHMSVSTYVTSSLQCCYLIKSRASDAQFATCDKEGKVSQSPDGEATLSVCLQFNICLKFVTSLLHLRLHLVGFRVRSGLHMGFCKIVHATSVRFEMLSAIYIAMQKLAKMTTTSWLSPRFVAPY